MGELMGVDLKAQPTTVTPKQAIKAGLDESIIATFSETPESGITLVADDGTAARKIFGASS
jgi:hypothetical protein